MLKTNILFELFRQKILVLFIRTIYRHSSDDCTQSAPLNNKEVNEKWRQRYFAKKNERNIFPCSGDGKIRKVQWRNG